MQKLILRSSCKTEEEFTKEVRKRVKNYFKENNISTKGNATLYFKAIILLSVYILPFVAILTIPTTYISAVFLAILMGIGEAGVGMSVMHDGAHGAFSSKKWINNLASATMFLMGSNTFNWKIMHNYKHHTFTNVFEHDGDISTKAVIRMSEHAPLKKYQRFQHLYAVPLFSLLTLVRFVADLFILLDLNKKGLTEEHKGKPTEEIVILVVTKIVYLLVMIGLPLLLTPYSIGQIILGFCIMHLVAGFIMATVFQLAHVVEGPSQPLPNEKGIIEKNWYVHQMETTSDFGRKNGLFSWYIGGLDYQIEHHLFSSISHVHYPKIAPIVEETAKEYGVPYHLQKNVFEAIGSNYKKLYELGRN